MFRMALEKDDFRRVSVIWEFRVTGKWVAARVALRLEMIPGNKSNHLITTRLKVLGGLRRYSFLSSFDEQSLCQS